ncbi:MAG: hypothetical protein CMN84_10465 [Spongiibacteraceae bacterium]|nr:hypothetical protein [Spongiibacteraceae bacterium]
MRHSLQMLSDHRSLHSPITTWPIMWSGVSQGLSEGESFSSSTSQALDYVQFEKGYRARAGVRAEFELAAANESTMLRGYAPQPREERQASIAVDAVGEIFAARLNYTYVDEPEQDSKKQRFDGSYLAANAGNWVMGVGAIDRWWGPGWQSSLILSSNARPIPSVWLNRKNPSAPEWRWLRWVGPWQLTLLAGQLEEERRIPDAKLLGARLTFMPLSGLEVGLVRAIQWGGKGRPQDSRSLGKALIGESNEVGDEVGNELAGFDFRYGFAAGSASYGLYGQFIGEDEAGNSPSKYMGLAGFDMATHWGAGSQRWFLEGVNTTARDIQDDADFNIAYEHTLYRSGYNYRGRNIANTYGSDATAYTLGVMQFFANGHNLALLLTDATLSRDGRSVAFGQQRNPEVRPQIVVARQPLFRGVLRYEFAGMGGWIALQAEYADQPIVIENEEDADWQLSASWKYRF